MKATYNQFIGIYENAFPKEWCEYVIDLFDKHPQYQLTRQESEKVNPKLKTDTHLLTPNSFLETPQFKKSRDFFYKKMDEIYISHYMGKFDCFIKKNYVISDFKIQKTKPSEGYHVWHHEWSVENEISARRTLVWTVYLNDIKEGGETEFLYQSLRVKPKQGTLVLFPSYYTHTHRGNPPLSGTKYIVTGWVLDKSYSSSDLLKTP